MTTTIVRRAGFAVIVPRMLGDYYRYSRQLPIALVMALPLLVAYELGLVLVGWQALNGADLLTTQVWRYLGKSGFVAFNAALLGGFVLAAGYLSRKKRFRPSFFIPLLVESALYAVAMGTIIIFVMEKAYLLGPTDLATSSVLTRLVISAGAGLHEELLFRLGMIPAIVAFWKRLVGSEYTAWPVALVVSSVLFSLAHFAVEPFQWFAFWYRTLAGAIFGVLFWQRGFAVAAYTHALYDVYVLLFS
jgi:membrane protease YdiL (CAAX protease family)